MVFADNQGSPATGQNQALRLITEEKVVALTGAYQSGITLTVSAIAEKYGIPFVNGELVAAGLTERGFKWFFRTTPVASDFAEIYHDFLTDMKAAGAKTDSIAIVHDNTEYGTSVANTITAAFKEKGRAAPIDVAYPANSTDVQSQVLQLKEKKPDVVIMITYTSDAILFAKTMQAQDYKPPMLLADDAGYSDPSFLKAVGKISQGAFNRSSWSVGPAGLATAIIAKMYKDKSGDEMDDTAGRQMTGFLVLMEAINRAGSTDPAKIQAALKATDLKPDQLMHRLQGREVRRQGPEHAGLRPHHPAAGRRKLCVGLAQGQRREGADDALQGLVILRQGRDIISRPFPLPSMIRFLTTTLNRQNAKDVLCPRSGDCRRPSARRRLCAVLLRPHAGLGHDERRQFRAWRLRHARHVRRLRGLHG